MSDCLLSCLPCRIYEIDFVSFSIDAGYIFRGQSANMACLNKFTSLNLNLCSG